MKTAVMGLICVVVLAVSTYAQRSYDQLFDTLLFDSSVSRLEEKIKEASYKHAIYSYNLANAATPGFKPILFEEDRIRLEEMVPADSKYFQKVIVEHMTTRLADNSKRHAAYYALYRKKFENYKQVATFGKK